MIIKSIKKLSLFEVILWLSSLVILMVANILTGANILVLIATLFGATALIFIAKGLPLGPILSMIYGSIYMFVAYDFGYYGEIAVFLLLSLPTAIYTLNTWLKHPYDESKEVKISRLNKKTLLFTIMCAFVISIGFYFILGLLNTENLWVSVFSVFTAMIAALLMIYRVPYYAIAYALNDIVLITLWVLASLTSITYIPVVICYVIFLINDLYAFTAWMKRRKLQQKDLQS